MAEGHENSAKNGDQATAGEKHRTDGEAPDAKRVKTEDKKQTTIEQSMGNGDAGENANDQSDENNGKSDEKAQSKLEDQEDQKDADDQKKGESNDKHDQKDEQPETVTAEDGAEETGAVKDVPSSILEKGIVYFFIRGRVNIEDPDSVTDIQRTFMVLRPLASDSKLTDGPIGDAGNSRLIALPKKTFPESGKDRFMCFVEKSGTSFEELKTTFLQGEDYETKTAGTRHTPSATPVGEGVYAVTTTGRESHFCYALTLPEEREEVQKELGLKDRGSFVLSTKNPEYPGPANAQLPKGPEFPKKVMEEFRSLRWMPTKPEHFDYPNAQILLIGESSGIEAAVEVQKEDKESGKKEPEEVLEELEEEDLKRMKGLKGDDSASIFKDLEARASEYPKLKTTF